MLLSPTFIDPGITAATDDDHHQLFALNPDYALPLQNKLTGLLSTFIQRGGRAELMDIQASTTLADFRLQPMPCYPDTSIDADMLHKLEDGQRAALTTYLRFSLKYGLLPPSFVASTIQMNAFKRTRQRQENLDYSSYWQHKIHSSLKNSDLDPNIVDFARQEMLTLYFAYTLIKGPLSEDGIHRAKEEAFQFYFGTSLHASTTPFSAASITDSEDSNSDMSDDEELQSMTSVSTASSLSVASPASSWTLVPAKKKAAKIKHLTTDSLPQAPEYGDKIGTIRCRHYMKGRCWRDKKCTYAHDDISKLAICPMWSDYGNCDNEECLLGHPRVNDQCISHKQEPTSEKQHGQKGNKQWAVDTESKMAATSERHVAPALRSNIDRAQNFNCEALKSDTKETEDNEALTSVEISKANKKQRTGRGKRGKPISLFTNDVPTVSRCLTYLNTNSCSKENCPYTHELGEFKKYSMPVCKHWRKGQCNNGRLCQFLHDDPFNEDGGSYVLEPAAKNQKSDVLDSNSFPTLGKHTAESTAKEAPSSIISYALAARQNPNAPHTPQSKRKAQCVDENGRAPTGGVIPKTQQSGSSEENDNGLTEVNQMRLHTIKCKWWWNEDRNCRFRNCWFAHADLSKVDECHWWLQGNCLKGDQCLYRHTTTDDDEVTYDDNFDGELGMSEMDEFSSNEDASTNKTRKCIRFWFGNGCERDADECYYAHEDLQYVGTCDYWLNDKVCPHGSTCPYKHGETIRALRWEDNPRKNNIFYDREESNSRKTDSERRYLLIAKLRTPPSPEVLPRMDSGCGKIELIYTPQRELAYNYGNKMCQAIKLYQEAIDQEGDSEKSKKLEREVKTLAKKMKKAHAVASQEIFTICNSDTIDQRKFIDVHGQHIGEAKQHIKQWLDGFQSSEPQVVYIVTGAGRHSKKEAASKGQLRPAILKYLQQMFETHETSVYGDDSGGVFAIIFCIHEYTSTYHCMKCPFIKKPTQ